MGKQLEWDKTGEKTYETGTKKGVLYPLVGSAYPKGYAWNGLSGVTESPSGAESTSIYADDAKYLNLQSAEELGLTIEAYTYPKQFEACDGSAEISTGIIIGQQDRQKFGFSYVTTLGSDDEGNAHGYKIHIIYNCSASPSEKAYSSINDSPEAITFSWEVKTTPVNVTGKKPTANVTIDSTKVSEAGLAAIEAALYGTDTEDPYLPLPDAIVALVTAADAAADDGE